MVRAISACLALAIMPACSCNQDDEKPEDNVQVGAVDPGHKVLHRLNRVEYNNTVQDLLGTQTEPANDFPYDNSSHGFDNIAETLTLSPLHVELYERAAEALAIEALAIGMVEPLNLRFEGEGPDVITTTGGVGSDYFNLWSNGDLIASVDLPETGNYRISALVWGDQAGPELVQAAIGHDQYTDQIFDVVADDQNSAEVIELELELTEGIHNIVISFLNDYYDPAVGDDRNLKIDYLAIEGPLDLAAGPNPMREALMVCDPASTGERACAEEVMSAFLPKAWRRPVTAAEVEGQLSVYDAVTSNGGDFEDGLRLTLQGALLSPDFIFRVEQNDTPDSEAPVLLGDYELASRLSYFLWSSTPDDLLYQAAADGSLQTTEGITEQVTRMLADPKSTALVDNFAGQWLYIRAIDDRNPDVWTFPNFDEDLRAAMKEEMTRFFDSFLTERRDMRELLTASEGEIDARLAAHYGISGVTDWSTVDLTADDRGGLLGMAGIHIINAYPARTSPVLRGKWVLSNLLCDEPPPPPAGVEGLIEDDSTPQTIREQLEQHRQDPMCASCHDAMDPIGLGMEHFDAIGAYRTEDAGFPIDASGTLPTGESFYGTRELSSVIVQDERLSECMAEKLFTYAMGRSPTLDDNASLDGINEHFTANDWAFEDLAIAIAVSQPFRMHRGETP